MASYYKVKPRFWALLIAVLLFAAGCVYVSQDRYMARQHEEIAKLEAEKAELALSNAKLSQKLEFSRTDEFIERTAREKLGLVKPGEILYENDD